MQTDLVANGFGPGLRKTECTMNDLSDWNSRVGESWADEWQRTDRSFGVLTDRLLDEALGSPVNNVLDIGCGAGELLVRLVEARPDAVFTGLDVSEALVAAAAARTADLPNAQVALGDASRWQDDDVEPFDLLVSRHGVMFFGDPVAVFAHLATIAAPAARLVFSCFRARADNPWTQLLEGALGGVSAPDDAASSKPPAPGPFAFGDADYVRDILSSAGWTDIAFDPVDYAMIGGVGADDAAAVEDALRYFLRIGPAARAVAALDGDAREEALARLRAMLSSQTNDGVVTLPSACWIVSGRAPG